MPETAPDRPRYLFHHIQELRKGLVHSLVAVGVGVALALWQSGRVFQVVLEPFVRALSGFPELQSQIHSLQTLSPVEVFVINMKLSVVVGVLLASPVILREIWIFAAPALKPTERAAILMVFSLGLFFFAGGLAFGYFLVVPLALKFLLSYNLDFHFIPQWTLDGYFGFMSNFLLVFGCVFELPLVLMALVAIGVATPEFLTQKRKHAILLIFVVAALINPSVDPVTQTVVAVPMILLYEVGILMAKIAARRRKAGLGG